MITNVLEYLENSAENFPDKTAYADVNSSLTFSELMNQAKSIGCYIKGEIKETGPVLVYLKKSPKCLAGFFGTLYAGDFYVPLDTEMPKARILLIKENLNPVAILSDNDNMESAKEIFENIPILSYDTGIKTEINNDIIERVRCMHLDTMPAYVLYTSGSTGIPKGVVVPHRSLIDYMEHFCEEIKVKSSDIIANQAPFYFDASLIDIYCTLKMGAAMYIVPLQHFSMPLKLLEFLEEYKVTMIRWVPSALNMVSAFKALKNLRPESLRLIIFGAESMPTKCYNYWRSFYPDADFVQIYGPTEITGVCTYYFVEREFADSETIPIGSAFRNSGVFLLSEDGLIEKNRPGVIGEICVKGSCLAHGYYNDIERTASVFVQNPLNKVYPELIYKTGDLASYNEYGEMVFASRKDFQIKHMGHRIELGEIENAVNALYGVKSAVCLFDQKKSRIHLVYVGEGVTETMIIEGLKESLPRYMIPNVFHQMEQMPMTATGKADRVRLKAEFGCV